MGKKVLLLFKNGKTKLAMIGLFMSFFIIPDFIILDIYRLRGTFILVFAFTCLFPFLCMVYENRFRPQRGDFFLVAVLSVTLIYALYTKYVMSITTDFWGPKLFGYIYSLFVPLIIVIYFRDAIIRDYNEWKPVLLYAIIAYAFKNYYLGGIMGFRENYLKYEGLKNVIFAAQILSIGTIISLYDLLRKYSFRTLAHLGICVLQVLLFESRGPILSTFCSGIILIWFHKIRGKKTEIKVNPRLFGIASACILLSIFGFHYLWNAGYLERIVEKFNMLSSGTRTEARYYLYPITWSAIKQHFPYGVGFGNSKIAISSINSYFQYNYPHNIILELLLEEGFYLAAPLIILLIKWFFSIFIDDRYTFHTLLFFTLFVFSFICALFSGDIVGNRNIFIFGYLAYGSKLMVKKQINNNRRVVYN